MKSFDPARFLADVASGRHYDGQIVRDEVIPARKARTTELSSPLPAELDAALREHGIEGLYTHQAQCIEAARRGENFVVVTGTASGKTFCYNLPILEKRIEEPGSKALYLYPTKALAQDQLRGLVRLQEAGGMKFRCGTYDGDTPSSQRATLRDRADLILTNPDMLHAGILPSHAKWAPYFERLRFVVIDEIHTYRGVFGSNVANVLRRLQRICAHYGSSPQFLCASATISNPGELSEKLCAAPVTVIDDDGAPRGSKHFVLWNPPLLDRRRESATRFGEPTPEMTPEDEAAAMTRRSSNSEAMHLFSALIRQGVPTITFVRARVAAELLLRYTQDELSRRAPRLVPSVRAYRGGYLASERREIEQQLFGGELLGVIATSALELGIDVGGLDACLLVGYPGSISATWQRAGRAGRSQGQSLALMIAGDGPIDQYLMHHPDYLFGKSPESAVIDAANPYILAKHLRCAAAELPLTLGEARKWDTYAPALVQLLEEEGGLRHAGEAYYWCGAGSPSREVSLRNVGDETYSIVDVERNSVIGSIDQNYAFTTAHTGAIYLHDAETYFIENLDLTKRVAWARRAETDYFTQSVSDAQIRIDETDDEKSVVAATGGIGGVTVTITIGMYKKVKFGSLDSLGIGKLDLPPQMLETTACWLLPPHSALQRLRECGRVPLEGLLGVANALVGVLPLRVLCDGGDVGALVDSSQLGAPALFVYDKFSGGLGFSQRAYDELERLLAAARDLIGECPCTDGCPSCVGSAAKTYTYYDAGGEAHARIPDKEAALVVLHEVLGLEPYVPRGAKSFEPIEPLPEGVEARVRRQLQRLKGI